MAHPCPAPGCPHQIAPGQVACADDLARMPTALRHDLAAVRGKERSMTGVRVMVACISWLQAHPAPQVFDLGHRGPGREEG